MPELLTRRETPKSVAAEWGFKSEWWPDLVRNGGRHQIGTVAGFVSESPASFRRNPHLTLIFCAETGSCRLGEALGPAFGNFYIRDTDWGSESMAEDIYDRVARLERKVDILVRAMKTWTETQLAERERERTAERRRRATRRPRRKE